jgi:hypothetical protein
MNWPLSQTFRRSLKRNSLKFPELVGTKYFFSYFKRQLYDDLTNCFVEMCAFSAGMRVYNYIYSMQLLLPLILKTLKKKLTRIMLEKTYLIKSDNPHDM